MKLHEFSSRQDLGGSRQGSLGPEVSESDIVFVPSRALQPEEGSQCRHKPFVVITIMQQDFTLGMGKTLRSVKALRII